MIAALLTSLAMAQAPEVAVEPRARVRAGLVVAVAQRDEASGALVAQAEALGGWFSALGDASVSLRVPVDTVGELIDFAAGLGVVADRSFDSADLTAAVVEKRARLAARREVLEQYMALLPTAEAGAVLTVEREIVSLVAQIERLEGSLRLLEHQADYAALTVDFRFRERAAPARDGSSSFAWLNTLNLEDLVEDLQGGWIRHWGPRPGASAPPPDGFSAYRRPRRDARAISPDEVIYRVRAARHRPRADLAFWSEAMKNRQLEAGYHLLRETALDTGRLQGTVLELTAPLGEEDYTYLVGVFPSGRRLIIVEAAGPIAAFEDRREAILAAVSGIGE